jgi:hypothetical protein
MTITVGDPFPVAIDGLTWEVSYVGAGAVVLEDTTDPDNKRSVSRAWADLVYMTTDYLDVKTDTDVIFHEGYWGGVGGTPFYSTNDGDDILDPAWFTGRTRVLGSTVSDPWRGALLPDQTPPTLTTVTDTFEGIDPVTRRPNGVTYEVTYADDGVYLAEDTAGVEVTYDPVEAGWQQVTWDVPPEGLTFLEAFVDNDPVTNPIPILTTAVLDQSWLTGRSIRVDWMALPEGNGQDGLFVEPPVVAPIDSDF